MIKTNDSDKILKCGLCPRGIGVGEEYTHSYWDGNRCKTCRPFRSESLPPPSWGSYRAERPELDFIPVDYETVERRVMNRMARYVTTVNAGSREAEISIEALDHGDNQVTSIQADQIVFSPTPPLDAELIRAYYNNRLRHADVAQ